MPDDRSKCPFCGAEGRGHSDWRRRLTFWSYKCESKFAHFRPWNTTRQTRGKNCKWRCLRRALHDAINSPKGVVPESAEEFYDAEMIRDGE